MWFRCSIWREITANGGTYITYRYAQNLSNGHGFVFNVGERVLGTTAPFHGLVLALMGLVTPDIRLHGVILSGLATIVLAWAVYCWLATEGAPRGGAVAVLPIATGANTYSVFPLETLLLAALEMLDLLTLQRRAYIGLGIFLGLSFLTRADAVLLGITLLGVLVVAGEPLCHLWKTAGTGLAVVTPWLTTAWLYYGQPLSTTASAKTAWPFMVLRR